MTDRLRTGLADWEDIRFFAALARHGSLSATSRALRVNHATVARRLAKLEEALHIQLFKRWPTGYELTAAGRTALEAAGVMESAATALSRLEPQKGLAGLVRITATPALAESFLLPRLAPLHQLHPSLELEITAERRLLSLKRHQADIALRFGRPEHGELGARKVVDIAYRFYATPVWRSRLERGVPPRLIGFDEGAADLPEATWLAREFRDTPLVLRCNSFMGQIAAARAGLGVAMVPHFLVANDRTLVDVSLSKLPPSRGLWLVTRRDSQTTEPMRGVGDFIIELIRRERPLFEKD